jgi:dinuclear metal center YbgI/SA1388 family protein
MKGRAAGILAAMTATVGEWLAALESTFPSAWAEGWDSTGLQVGDRTWPAGRILVALDPAPEVLAEARDRRCSLVVAHHPLLFRPLERVDLADPVARSAVDAAGGRVAVAACHTNADVAMPGVSDALTDALALEVTGILRPTGAGSTVKLVTFVPVDATAMVIDAVAHAGAGVIGEYTHCSFRVTGRGTFLPSDRARPAVGDRGSLNEVEEDRLEVVVPRERLAETVEAMIAAHPYEEVAYDVYATEGPTGLGLGRTGRLTEPETLAVLAKRCSETLGTRVRLAGPSDRRITEVAVCGGSGGNLIPDAIRAGVGALVTGDVKHHHALDAIAAGLGVVDAGHFATEWPFIPRLAERLRETGLGEVEVSAVRTDPFSAT